MLFEAPFGMTLGEWLKHQGTGTYTCTNGEGTLDTQFTGLVANGVYTMWHAFTAIPATKPFSGALELPLGARYGACFLLRASRRVWPRCVGAARTHLPRANHT